MYLKWVDSRLNGVWRTDQKEQLERLKDNVRVHREEVLDYIQRTRTKDLYIGMI